MLMDIFRSPLYWQVRHMFKEIDYILEGQNAERFASLYGSYQFMLVPEEMITQLLRLLFYLFSWGILHQIQNTGVLDQNT
ncbi:hypothetical protein CK203_061416 [Vitis vinifera]|uniref:Uncharacterized protein n=1 Tax=Vitis vinifera TaxID=29760 RepID=A0A438GF81_VITVI|nr:hypothetical protein CK203_061416 [Vitis vinifera]